MRGKLTILSLILIIIVSGCSDMALQGKKISMNEVNELYPCMDVTCSENEVCNEGNCVCDANSQLCEEKCIPKTGCCSNDDCGTGEDCINNQCFFSCNNVQAVSNKVCDPVQKGLVCMPGYEWCEDQNRCIPNDHCCKRFDCSRGQRCIRTSGAAEVCLEVGGEIKNCRFLNVGEEKTLISGDIEAKVKINSIFYDKKAEITVNEKTVDLPRGSRYAIGPDQRILLIKIKEYGGSCRKD